jgi:hypothetical protein
MAVGRRKKNNKCSLSSKLCLSAKKQGGNNINKKLNYFKGEITMAVDFDVIVELDKERDGNQNQFCDDAYEEFPERMLIYFVKIKLPLQEGMDCGVMNELKEEIMKNATDCTFNIVDEEIVFDIHRDESIYFTLVDELYELKEAFITSLSPILEKRKVDKCKIVFEMNMAI